MLQKQDKPELRWRLYELISCSTLFSHDSCTLYFLWGKKPVEFLKVWNNSVLVRFFSFFFWFYKDVIFLALCLHYNESNPILVPLTLSLEDCEFFLFIAIPFFSRSLLKNILMSMILFSWTNKRYIKVTFP